MTKALGVSLILALVGLGMPVSTLSEELDVHQPPAKFYTAVPDLLLARPALVLGALVPTAGFWATLPLTKMCKQDMKMAEYLVHRPWSYATDRPLGVFAPSNIIQPIDEKISTQYQDYFIRVGGNRSPDKR
jgi:hypothetical protein